MLTILVAYMNSQRLAVANKRPLISIVTVCFNEAKNIRLTCDSVKSQTYAPIEWIVIDGGSTDGTQSILAEYQDHIAYFVSENDKGIYHGMNKGIAQATGDYLLFLNGGDYLIANTILDEVVTSMGDLSADIYYGEVRLNDPDVFYPRMKGAVLDKAFFYAGYTLSHQAMFIKRQLFSDYGQYDESYKLLGDAEWTVRVLIKGCAKAVYIDHVVSVFDMGGASQNAKNHRLKLSEKDKMLRKHYGFFERLKLEKQTQPVYHMVWYKRWKDRFMLVFRQTAVFRFLRYIYRLNPFMAKNCKGFI